MVQGRGFGLSPNLSDTAWEPWLWEVPRLIRNHRVGGTMLLPLE